MKRNVVYKHDDKDTSDGATPSPDTDNAGAKDKSDSSKTNNNDDDDGGVTATVSSPRKSKVKRSRGNSKVSSSSSSSSSVVRERKSKGWSLWWSHALLSFAQSAEKNKINKNVDSIVCVHFLNLFGCCHWTWNRKWLCWRRQRFCVCCLFTWSELKLIYKKRKFCFPFLDINKTNFLKYIYSIVWMMKIGECMLRELVI